MTANRYEQVAAPTEEAKEIFDRALETYCAQEITEKRKINRSAGEMLGDRFPDF